MNRYLLAASALLGTIATIAEQYVVLIILVAIVIVMDVISGALRGLGHSLKPAIVIVFGVCVFRMIWIFTVFRHDPTLETLFIVYPVSWILICLINGTMLYIVCRKMLKNASRRLFDK